MERAEVWVRDALEGAAALGGASRALAAALACAGALGAADRLVQRYVDAREEDSESEDGEVFEWDVHFEEVLLAVGRHLPEVRASRAALRRPCSRSGAGGAAGLTRCGRRARPLRCWRTWASTTTAPACALGAPAA
jgi:hypothetical protein